MTGGLSRREWLLLGGALALVVVATAHKLANGLVWDDIYVIEQGDVIHDWGNLSDVLTHRTMYVSTRTDLPAQTGVDTWRPVTLVTFMWDATISGRDPTSYHVTNLLLHLACVVLVFFLARRLLPTSSRALAPLAAAWFGVTPLLGEAHVWIDGRSDPTCTALGLSALLLWRRGVVARSIPMLASASAVFFLGLLSKEVLLLTLPAIIAWPVEEGGERRSTMRRLRDAAGLLGAAVLYLGLRGLVLSGLRTHHDGDHLIAALLRLPALLLDGLASLLVPTGVYVRSLSDDYHALGPWVLGALALPVIAVGVLLVLRRARVPLLSFCALWYAATLAPAAIIATLLWPGFGRFLYLPAVAVAIALAAVAGRIVALPAVRDDAKRKRLLAVGCALYLAVLAGRLHVWVYDWHDEVTLYGAIVEAAPERAHGHGWLGMTHVEQGRPAEAIPHLATADRLSPNRPRYLLHLGWALAAVGDTEASLNVAATGLGRYDGAPRFHALAAHNLRQSRPDLTASHLLECLAREPTQSRCRAMVRELCTDAELGEVYRSAFESALAEAGDVELDSTVRPLIR